MRMNIRYLMGVMLTVVGISTSLTSIFIINIPFITAVFIAWTMVGLVLIATSKIPFKTGVNPSSLALIYENVIDNVIEEFGLHDLNPLYVPSKKAGEPVMLLSLSDEASLEGIPKRMLIFMGRDYMLRLPTLGTIINREVGGAGEDLASAEANLKMILTDYLEIADDVMIMEDSGGDGYIVKVQSPKIKYKYRTNPPSNIYCQIIGPLLSEATGMPLLLNKLIIDKGSIQMKFKLLGE